MPNLPADEAELDAWASSPSRTRAASTVGDAHVDQTVGGEVCFGGGVRIETGVRHGKRGSSLIARVEPLVGRFYAALGFGLALGTETDADVSDFAVGLPNATKKTPLPGLSGSVDSDGNLVEVGLSGGPGVGIPGTDFAWSDSTFEPFEALVPLSPVD